MRSRRPLVHFLLLGVLTWGSLLATGGYAWYLHSDRYRRSCAARLSASLGLPAEIGRVVPRSRLAREFQDIRVWLPARRDEAAFVERALVVYRPAAEDPEAYDLVLSGGRCEISSRTWLRDDYRFVLESGLRPGFDPTGPRRVSFSGMDVAVERDRFRATLRDAQGVVSFEDPRLGRAAVTCRELNAWPADEPVTLTAEFSPRAAGIRLERIALVVPRLPLLIVGLADLVGVDVRSGAFDGQLVYGESEAGRTLTVRGRVLGVPLAELTAGLLPRPWRGVAPEIELEELAVRNDRPQRVRFRGVVVGAVLGDVLAPWGLGAVGGELTLRVQAAELSAAGIDRFITSGRCENLSLEELSAALGRGRMTGQARIVIDDLTVIGNRLASLDAEVVVLPAGPEPNWIERDLVSALCERTLGFGLPAFLPERFEYSALGVRLQVRDEVLYVFGTHGPGDRMILTVRVGGRDVGVVPEPERPIELGAFFDTLRGQAAAYLREQLATLAPDAVWPLPEPLPTRPAGPPADPLE